MPNSSISKVNGICHLCGVDGRLTFEHIPPKRVFNNKPVLLETLETMLRKFQSPRKFRRGLGRATLCERCNGFTAHHYGSAFADWTCQAMRFVHLRVAHPILVPFNIEPLRVIKQIMVMALATTDLGGPGYLVPHRRFTLYPFERFLPPNVRVFIYFNRLERFRLTGNAAVLRDGRSDYVLGDIAFPPLGYCVLHTEDALPPLAESEALCDITWFSHFHLGQRRDVYLSIPTRTPVSACPLAFAESPGSTVPGGTVLLGRTDNP